MVSEEQHRRVKRTAVALLGMALCFYFGFIIATGLSS